MLAGVDDQAPNDLRLQGAAQRARELIAEIAWCLAVIEGREAVPGQGPSEAMRLDQADRADRVFLLCFNARQLDAFARVQFADLVREAARVGRSPAAVLAEFAKWFPEHAAPLCADDVGALIAVFRPRGGGRAQSAATGKRRQSQFEQLLAATFKTMGIRTSAAVIRDVLRGYRPRPQRAKGSGTRPVD